MHQRDDLKRHMNRSDRRERDGVERGLMGAGLAGGCRHLYDHIRAKVMGKVLG